MKILTVQNTVIVLNRLDAVLKRDYIRRSPDVHSLNLYTNNNHISIEYYKTCDRDTDFDKIAEELSTLI